MSNNVKAGEFDENFIRGIFSDVNVTQSGDIYVSCEYDVYADHGMMIVLQISDYFVRRYPGGIKVHVTFCRYDKTNADGWKILLRAGFDIVHANGNTNITRND